MRTDKADQHFVPVFYLKRFSLFRAKPKKKPSINLFLFAQDLYVQFAKLRNQASRRYFYGEDGQLENQLGSLEAQMAKALNSISEDNVPSSGPDFSLLLFLVTLTDFRNPIRASQLQKLLEMKSSTAYNGLAPKAILDTYLPQILAQLAKNNVSESLSIALPTVEIIRSLDLKLIINKTENPFITSDNPIVLYNQFFEQRSSKHIYFAFGSMGIQIFFPIDSRQLLLLYDSNVYLVGREGSKTITISNRNDIDQLNLLQFQNCANSIFGNEGLTALYAQKLKKKCSKFKRPSKADWIRETGKIHNVKIDLQLTFISLRMWASKAKLDSKRLYTRPEVEHIRDELKSVGKFEINELRQMYERLMREKRM